MTNRTPPDPTGVEDEILRRSRRLKDPVSYLRGESANQPLLPSNILMFHRTRAASFRQSEHTRWQHHRFLLLVALRGNGLIGLDEQVHPLREGQCLVIFPFQSHCFFQVSPPSIHWMMVTFELSQHGGLAALRNQSARTLRAEDLAHLRDLLRSWQSGGRRETLALYLSLWLHDLARKRQPVQSSAKPSPAHTEAGHFVTLINRLILANRNRPTSIAGLSKLLGLSASSLRSRFKAYTGQSIGRYVRGMKLNHACELLVETQLSIGEISDRCGYDSVFAFSRAFRTVHGCPPTRYRAAGRQEKVRNYRV